MSNKIIDAVNSAEQQGYAKFKTENGTLMVVVTQAELDAVIKQREDAAVRYYRENLAHAKHYN